MVVKIVKVLPLSTRNYTDRQGQEKVFKSKGFILHDGKSSFYAEAVQETAESIEALNPKSGEVVCAHLTCRAREFTTDSAEVRYSNDITISNMMKL